MYNFPTKPNSDGYYHIYLTTTEGRKQIKAKNLDCKKGPHSFRRNGIAKVCNATGGNIMMASVLYGNSPRSAAGHYYTGVDLNAARSILEGNQEGNQKGGLYEPGKHGETRMVDGFL